MTDEQLDHKLSDYRAATDEIRPPADLIERVLSSTPRRARLRQFVRQAQTCLWLALLVGAGSGLWAFVETAALERQAYIQLNAWAETQ